MVLQEFQENEVDEDPKETLVIPDQQAKTDVLERTEKTALMEPQVFQDDREMPEMQEIKVHMEPLVHQEHQEHPEMQEHQDQLDHEDLTAALDNQEPEDQRELLAPPAQLVPQEFQDDQVQKDTRDQWDDTVCQDQLDQLGLQVIKDQTDQQDNQDHRDAQEILDQMDQLDHQDPQDHQEAMDKWEMKVPLDQPEITESQDQPDQLDQLDHQDHPVTSATCFLVISGTLSTETKELHCTEANDQPMMPRWMLTLTNSSQEATSFSRTSLTSGRSLPTNTSNTKDWEPRASQLDHAETYSN